MPASAFLKAAVLWLAILVLAMLNGTLREKVLVPNVGSFGAFIASGTILSICIFAVAWLGASWYPQLSSAQWLAVGAFWLLQTLVFEFGFGRFAQHKTWADLFEAYTFEGGNIWPLVLAATLISPWLVAKWRGLL